VIEEVDARRRKRGKPASKVQQSALKEVECLPSPHGGDRRTPHDVLTHDTRGVCALAGWSTHLDHLIGDPEAGRVGLVVRAGQRFTHAKPDAGSSGGRGSETILQITETVRQLPADRGGHRCGEQDGRACPTRAATRRMKSFRHLEGLLQTDRGSVDPLETGCSPTRNSASRTRSRQGKLHVFRRRSGRSSPRSPRSDDSPCRLSIVPVPCQS
jgi:hypothetical protein